MTLIDDPFSLNHLPYGIVTFTGDTHLAIRLKDEAISLEVLREYGLLNLPELTQAVTRTTSLNPLINLPPSTLSHLRDQLGRALSQKIPPQARCRLAPYPQDDKQVLSPILPGDYVDFYASQHHAFRVGCLFRGPDQALPSQYFDLPIGYHGRTSTLLVSGTPIKRPQGITAGPCFGPTRQLDYELEVAFLLHPCSQPVTPDDAAKLLFGMTLLNDWSARDIQAYEYRPLGPFLGKSFATSIGAWVTPIQAFSRYLTHNKDSNHPVLPHLQEKAPHHLDIPLWANLDIGSASTTLCKTSLRHLAWSAAQMVAHLTSNGTIIRPGDLIATGTISGPQTGSQACLLERTSAGKHPFAVGASTRTFLEDGDTITLLGGYPGLGLAPCRGQIIPAAIGKEI